MGSGVWTWDMESKTKVAGAFYGDLPMQAYVRQISGMQCLFAYKLQSMFDPNKSMNLSDPSL
jgi:hypothetical protein